MTHLAHEQLWAHARGELSPDDARAAGAHLADCPDCRVCLEDVVAAQAALFALPEPPPMPDAVARRVGQHLAELADAEAARAFAPWWRSLFTLRLALVAALAVAVLGAGAWLAGRSDPAPAPVATPTPGVAPVPSPAPQPTAPAKKLTVVVATAKKASAGKQQVLEEGAKVTTAAGGSLWMKLPDGSRAGLTSASEVTLATLATDALTLDLARGNLALEVPHREDRVLTVRAGEVEVKDLGTRFLVSRQADKTLVAVEEGVVEVKTPAGTREVKAGRAVTWRQGKLQELPWEVPEAGPKGAAASPSAVAVAASAPAAGTEPSTPEIPAEAAPSSVARLDEEEDEGDLPPPLDEAAAAAATPDRTPVPADEQWAGLPPPPPPPPGTVTTAAPVPMVARKPMPRGFSLRELERRLYEVGQAITTPPNGAREAEVRAITRYADVKDCEHALDRAARWLRAPPSASPQEPQLRRAVKVQQLRCLTHLGRTDEAAAIQRELQAPP